MRVIPRRVLLAISGVGVLALAAFALAVSVESVRWEEWTLLVTALLTAMVTLTRLMPVPINPKTKTTFATVPLFVGVLLLPVAPAMTAAGLGAMSAELPRRVRWFQAVFNTGETALRTAAGASVFAVAVIAGSGAGPEPLIRLTAAVMAALTMYLVNTSLVEGLVGIQLLHFEWRAFRQRRRRDAGLEGAMFLAGLMLAIVSDVLPPAILLTAVALLLARRAPTMRLRLSRWRARRTAPRCGRG
jgi:hypothetical protein